ncbi:MAG TPA: 1-(5-phosphoribosyl)-5-((5-phosphoribosylamino)methylideneamino)imidazole-4-carboxamide isomerase [Cytophagales bacterium]|nr:1-(5-phosphoribosyl)-5-((5-phosphoribosylamino)methylideneamino)imidazole-4-carboxamide isomerase [Cytophagales bacterium]HAA22282.1 1-(5-phosphoribosyl)-5-((5-phosphoribosylamino)methylideneamino)imidazole-4-carboxamide isomerase [Cytophagales bacterium]HAP60766.1 1-(5-phosphoribosyl)-5-((5-phosphoribosylamino)methylideneamino)imidazole-4-carboxamide isomerase [Cytophagales bacterium]
MIEIIPSITVLEGNVVKMKAGDKTREVIYNENPLDLAMRFQDAGIRKIHLIDLEGARRGAPINYPVLEQLSGYTNLKINFSGGIHTDGDVNKAFECGATRITAASLAVTNPELFNDWIISYGRERIMLGAGALDGKIRIRGWQKETNVTLDDHIEYFYNRSLKYVKSADISRDGLLEGPNFSMYEHLVAKFPELFVVAMGGVRSIEDVKQLEDIGVGGVLVGRAIYDGKIKLEELRPLVDKYPDEAEMTA